MSKLLEILLGFLSSGSVLLVLLLIGGIWTAVKTGRPLKVVKTAQGDITFELGGLNEPPSLPPSK